MDFFHGVVRDYLRASPTRFVNAECLLRLDETPNPRKDRHWYCDFLTIDFSDRTVYLCEVTYARNPQALLKRLRAWLQHWQLLKLGIRRDCQVDETWTFAVWLFLPEAAQTVVNAKVEAMLSEFQPPDRPSIRFETTESVLPWKYRSWNGRAYAKA